ILQAMRNYPDPINAEEGKVIDAAEEVLARIGLKALPAVVKELESANVNDRRLAAATLRRMVWTIPDKAMPHVLRALKDADGGVSNWALQGLQGADPKIPGLAAAFRGALQDAQANNRLAALVGLFNLGPEATRGAIPALIRTLKDEHFEVRRNAV